MLERPEPLSAVLKELEANATRVVLLSDAREALAAIAGAVPLAADVAGLEGEVWRGLASRACIGVEVAGGAGFAERCTEVALRLALTKLVWIDAAGGLSKPDGSRRSFVGLDELRRILADGSSGGGGVPLVEIEAALARNIAFDEARAADYAAAADIDCLSASRRDAVYRRLGQLRLAE